MYHAERDTLLQRQPGQAKLDCSDCASYYEYAQRESAPYVGSMNIGEKTFQCAQVYPKGKAKKWMSMHDNYGGYSIAVDESLSNQVPESGFPSEGELIRMAGSNSDFVEYCKSLVDEKIDFKEHKIIDFVARLLLPFGPVSATKLFEGAVKWGAKRWLAPLCPQVEGYWPKYFPHVAMEEYNLNSSTIKKSDFHEVSMFDIRWHPVDNLITKGYLEEQNLIRLPIPHEEEDVQILDAMDLFDDAFDLRVYRLSAGGRHNLPPKGKGKAVGGYRPPILGVQEETVPRPTHIGNLKALGRVLHGMSDLAVPGHVTGHLLGAEHLIVEESANAFVHEFSKYKESTSETGAVQFVAEGIGGSYTTIDGLFNPLEVWKKLRLDVAFGRKQSMEQLAENAARETRKYYLAEQKKKTYERMANRDVDAEYLDEDVVYISARLRRSLVTSAVLNNVMGSVKAIKDHYARYSSTPWNEITEQISWTNSDATLVAQPGKNKEEFPIPGYFDRVTKISSLYDFNIDHNYQEFQENDGCYVESHTSMQGVKFVNAYELGAKVTFSSSNFGRDGDTIHLTGSYSEGEMDQEYYRGDLSESSSQVVVLPAGAIQKGFAVWCSGPDIYRKGYTPNRDPIDLECDIENIELLALPCNSAEKTFWNLNNLQPVELELELPTLPAGEQEKYLEMAKIDVLAVEYQTSPSGLAQALASSHGKVVKLLDPSPWGRASFVWTDEHGLSNITTVKDSGSIMTKRNRRKIILESKNTETTTTEK